jgi:hypothetical protein
MMDGLVNFMVGNRFGKVMEDVRWKLRDGDGGRINELYIIALCLILCQPSSVIVELWVRNAYI